MRIIARGIASVAELLADFTVHSGGVAVMAAGERSHDVGCMCADCDGRGTHMHQHGAECFLVLSGAGILEGSELSLPYTAGDVLWVDPGCDHHLCALEASVVCWLHLA